MTKIYFESVVYTTQDILRFAFLRNMLAPCSNDLRWQIVWLVLGIRKTTDETARLMGVTRRTVINPGGGLLYGTDGDARRKF